MKQWTLRILLCLIVGAITTVAAAWGCAWFPQRIDAVQYSRLDPEAQHWHRPMSVTELGPSLGSTLRLRGETVTYLLAPDEIAAQGVAGMVYAQAIHAFGFPMRAMEYEVDSTINQQKLVIEITILQGSATNNTPSVFVDTHRQWRNLPARPIWPAFLIDTLFFAAIWFAIPFGFATAKRFIRIKRGRCPRCGYDLRGEFAAGCSECGWGRSTD